MYYNQVPMLTHWRHMHDRGSFVDAQATRAATLCTKVVSSARLKPC